MASIIGVQELQHTNGTSAVTIDTGGVVAEPNKEYFRVDLTSAQTGIADEAEATVDFNSNGAVAYDTKSKFDAANNAYLFASSGGVYLISFGCLICSDAVNTEVLQDAGAQVEVATDGSTYVGLFGAYARTEVTDGAELGSIAHSGTYIYKTTNTTTKIRLRTKADCNSADTYEIRVGDDNMNSLTFTATNGRGTYLNVVRIA